MRVILFFLLALASCVPTTKELRDAARSCGEGPECFDLWEKVRDREDRIAEREREENLRCPRGQVMYEDWTGVTCISQTELRHILGRY